MNGQKTLEEVDQFAPHKPKTEHQYSKDQTGASTLSHDGAGKTVKKKQIKPSVFAHEDYTLGHLSCRCSSMESWKADLTGTGSRSFE